MGINFRNLEGIAKFNPRKQFRWLDDKILTREICAEAGVPCPEIYCTIDNRIDIRKFEKNLQTKDEFVIKPARGAKGKGIMIITDRRKHSFFDINGTEIRLTGIHHHLNEILHGMFSLSELPDRAIIEQRVSPHPVFSGLSPAGTPDIRIILIESNPVMAMLRLPTKHSRGRANLSMGAVGVGISMEDGITTNGILYSEIIDRHPDTGEVLRGIQLPYWDEILSMSTRFGAAVESRFAGIDIILDGSRGPLLLEANNRPGLQIQLANQQSLRPYFSIPSSIISKNSPKPSTKHLCHEPKNICTKETTEA